MKTSQTSPFRLLVNFPSCTNPDNQIPAAAVFPAQHLSLCAGSNCKVEYNASGPRGLGTLKWAAAHSKEYRFKILSDDFTMRTVPFISRRCRADVIDANGGRRIAHYGESRVRCEHNFTIWLDLCFALSVHLNATSTPCRTRMRTRDFTSSQIRITERETHTKGTSYSDKYICGQQISKIYLLLQFNAQNRKYFNAEHKACFSTSIKLQLIDFVCAIQNNVDKHKWGCGLRIDKDSSSMYSSTVAPNPRYFGIAYHVYV
ncbi:hypothetical protein CEXT_182421 [Caerostris extrusa]|uniref:Uncharacterized protein n=1 Tax=Caerostris extrusa TaxID=172846 RepID=A0AAV4MBM9_CAEEX|nr:hypothetical protein CEXT_182421 [Caerostris extrusa]